MPHCSCSFCLWIWVSFVFRTSEQDSKCFVGEHQNGLNHQLDDEQLHVMASTQSCPGIFLLSPSHACQQLSFYSKYCKELGQCQLRSFVQRGGTCVVETQKNWAGFLNIGGIINQALNLMEIKQNITFPSVPNSTFTCTLCNRVQL